LTVALLLVLVLLFLLVLAGMLLLLPAHILARKCCDTAIIES